MPKFIERKDLSFKDYYSVFKNKGYFIPEEGAEPEKVELKDAVTHHTSTTFYPMVIDQTIKEAVEPKAVGTSLLDRIDYTPGIRVGSFSVGAITAEDVNTRNEYPEYTINYGPGSSIVTVGKAGLALKFSEDVIRYSQWDLLNRFMVKAGEALIRHRESKIWAMLSKMGVVTHDNANPGNSVWGTTSGYDISGSANGSVTPDDLIEAILTINKNGFNVDTIAVHPFAFTMFLTDPVLRQIMLNGGQGAWFNGWTGDPVARNPWAKDLGKRGPHSVGQVPELNMTAGPKIPDYLGIPLKVVVSPYLPFNDVTKVTDIYLVQSGEVGAFIVDMDPESTQMEDKYHEVNKIKVRESYAIEPYNEGQAVAVLKNVKAIPNKIVTPIQPTISSFTPVNRTNPIA